LDKKYNSLLLRAAICEKCIEEDSRRESKKGRDETKPQDHGQDPKPILPCKTAVSWPSGYLQKGGEYTSKSKEADRNTPSSENEQAYPDSEEEAMEALEIKEMIRTTQKTVCDAPLETS